jgi:hypothetical protein
VDPENLVRREIIEVASRANQCRDACSTSSAPR